MTAVIDLAALPPTVVVPGLLHWLGIEQPEEEPETYEQFLERISQEPAR
ncbi:hypothetical protein ABZ636_03660 [Streptomyces sp. NPDC007251]